MPNVYLAEYSEMVAVMVVWVPEMGPSPLADWALRGLQIEGYVENEKSRMRSLAEALYHDQFDNAEKKRRVEMEILGRRWCWKSTCSEVRCLRLSEPIEATMRWRTFYQREE